jgi:hypothetical protein
MMESKHDQETVFQNYHQHRQYHRSALYVLFDSSSSQERTVFIINKGHSCALIIAIVAEGIRYSIVALRITNCRYTKTCCLPDR